jgi:hypothetical protein
MASQRTKLSELGTAVGLCWDPAGPWPESVEAVTVPGIAPELWQPAVLPATATGSPDRDLLLRALHNGHEFRRVVLRGRAPEHVEWSGSGRSVWTSDVPRDLTVDRVWFLQAKYDSTCVLNTAPGTLVDELLADDAPPSRPSWYEEVALAELQAYYRAVRRRPGLETLPTDVRDVDGPHRAALKAALRSGAEVPAAEERTYGELCAAVSVATTLRWRRRLASATSSQRTQLLFRMLRIGGGPYWLLGTKGSAPVQLAVTDTRSWRNRFTLQRFTVLDAHAGQPQVDWRADVIDTATRTRHPIEGYCEIRWSHGKLMGHPECKVQVATPLEAIPGYEPMA